MRITLWLQLALKMLRYRVALMLLMFFSLGIALHGKITEFSFDYLWVAIALALSYVAATCINDIIDRDIDAVNHPSSAGRPLVTKEATATDLYIVHFAAALAALAFASLAGVAAVYILLISLLINYVYSLPPIKLSYRTHFAPVILSIAYVFIPYWLGTTVAHATVGQDELSLIAGLLCIFLGRIILKDFRDRKGDAMYGKPTFLLHYGKRTTCLISLVSIMFGNVLLIMGLPDSTPTLLICLELLFAAIIYALYNLSIATEGENEQLAIGIGAKMGNGLLLTLLGYVILGSYSATTLLQNVYLLTSTAIFLYSFHLLSRHPEQARNNYRG
jgi:4-hydroxybenzoate polyprenyltransferase